MRILTLPVLFIAFLSCGPATVSGEKGEEKIGLAYLALGDSYTIGESVDEEDRYPNQLAAALREMKMVVAAPQIVARTGWTTDELQQGIKSAEIENEKYDLVSLLIGVNNEFRGRSVEEYEKQFAALLDQAIAFAYGRPDRVFVVSIPDYGFSPYGENRRGSISKRIDLFNNAAKKIAEAKNVAFYDITPISRRGLADPALVADDGLHPSGKQYKAWTDLIVKDVAAQLKK